MSNESRIPAISKKSRVFILTKWLYFYKLDTEKKVKN